MTQLSLQDVFNQAVQLHRTGQLDAAWNIYLQLQNHLPNHPEIPRLMGLLLNQTGQFAQAEQLLRKALSLNPRVAGYYCDLADALLAQAKSAEALETCRHALSIDPNLAVAWNTLGNILNRLNRHEESLAALQKALSLHENFPDAHLNLGLVFLKLGRLDDAIASTQNAIALSPANPNAFNNLGNMLWDKGSIPQALEQFEKAVSLQPDFIEALVNKALALSQLNRLDESLATLNQALSLNENHPDIHLNLGIVLSQLNRLDQAIAAARRAVELAPNLSHARIHLANLLLKTGAFPQALDQFQHAVALDPQNPEAFNNLGMLLSRMGQNEQAVDAYQKAVELSPSTAAYHSNLGGALREIKQIDEAIAAYQKAVELDPAFAPAFNNLGSALKEIGLLDQAVAAYRKSMELNPNLPNVHSNLLLTLQYIPDNTLEEEQHERALWAKRYAHGLCVSPAPFTAPHPPRLRVAFVSPDLRFHPVGRFLLPLLAHLDRSRFFIAVYCDGVYQDPVTQHLKSHADLWVDSTTLSDEQLDQRIRHDNIHILIDLSSHSFGNRLLVFARKPAPLQVSWLAYNASTGLSTIDYRFSDPHMDPPGRFDHYYPEKTLRLPNTYWCYPGPMFPIPLTPPPHSNTGKITFGCLNAFCKISPKTLDCWIKILSQLPGSILNLHAPPGACRKRLVDYFHNAGLDPSRVHFLPFMPPETYFNAYNQIDIALDPFPFNGGTTSLDALWMGLPLITLAGDRPVGRAGLSILSNLNLTEFAANTPQQYVQIAVNLANNPQKIAPLRSSMRDRMLDSPLMNAPQFAGDFGNLLFTAWNQLSKNRPG